MDAGGKLGENFRRKFSYESENPRMDFRFAEWRKNVLGIDDDVPHKTVYRKLTR